MKLSPDLPEAQHAVDALSGKPRLPTAPGCILHIYFFSLMSTEARVCSQSMCIAQVDPV